MTPDQPTDDQLAELRRRWEDDPGSRIFLQLAEEYRRAERFEEAVEVLSKGLESHPNQVSALVALGRSRLALGQPREAAEALEKAVAIDATNLAAMKLSVEAYLQQGDRDNARQRLELYKLLNEGDEEIEELEARLTSGTAPPPPPGPDAESAESAASAGTPAEAAHPDAAEPHPGAAPDQWSPTGAWPGLPKEADDEGGVGSVAPSRDAEPFGDLASAGELRLYLAGLRSEGLFLIGDAEEPDAESPQETAAAEAEAAPDADVASEEPAFSKDVDDVGEPAATPAAPREAERPTVTLGNLYLEQGHHREAAGIFAALLDADPGNDLARAGLEQARAAMVQGRPAGFTLTAEQLLAEADPSLPPRQGMLRAYLQRIRNAT